MSILCLIKYIKPKYEIIYPDQRNHDNIPKFSKKKSDFKSAPSKEDTSKISLRLESWYLLVHNAQIQGFELKIFENKCQIWSHYIQNKVYAKCGQDEKVNTFWPKMPKFRPLESKFSKAIFKSVHSK